MQKFTEGSKSVGSSNYSAAPSHEYYGFVIYLLSYLALGVYLVWAFVPDATLNSFGILYIPNKYWALVWPFWILITYGFVQILFVGYNLFKTPDASSFSTLTDEHAQIQMGVADEGSVPGLHDIPIGLVNLCTKGAE